MKPEVNMSDNAIPDMKYQRESQTIVAGKAFNEMSS